MPPFPGAEIRIEGLSRAFGAKRVLDGVSWSIPPGQRLALLGPNGSGKTTLLRVLATLLAPSAGDAWIGGISVGRAPRAAKARVGWMPASDGGFLPRLTGIENLRLFASLSGIPRAEAERRVRECAETPVIRAALEAPYHLGSAGMRQSLHLMRLLVSAPEALLMDEPTRSLDAASRAFFWEFLRERLKGRTVVFATHSEEEARALSNATARIEGGRLLA